MRVLLDQPDRIYFSAPREVLFAHKLEEVHLGLAKAEVALAQGFHVAGWLGYELGYALEPRLAGLCPTGSMLFCLGVFDDPSDTPPKSSGRAYTGPLKPELDANAYEERFASVKKAIVDGEIYQANLSFRARFVFAGDPLALYERLRQQSQARYCGFIEYEDGGTSRHILSLSPELFFDLTEDGEITARPMKGTSPRGPDDIAGRAALSRSAKNRAENLMIVDLIRNDLGRIAEIGSVKAFNLFAVETYPVFHTMVSTVTARKRPGAGIVDLLKALFPCGSITGAPKIRAMEILRSLEASPRGAYCGAVGHLAPDGSARFNVAIRTLTIENGRGEIGLGGGVVHDSVGPSEYAECQLKGHFFEAVRRPFHLIETLRRDSTFVRLDSHLDRMAASARVFGLNFDRSRALAALQDAVGSRNESLRVRLTLDETGTYCATSASLGATPSCWTYRIATDQILSTDLFQRHKTNWRDLYESASSDVDEWLFTNERGELVEGARTNIFLERNGVLLTPPVSAGALDGRLRAELLNQQKAREATLMPCDLQKGHLFCGNSLRGLIPAVPG